MVLKVEKMKSLLVSFVILGLSVLFVSITGTPFNKCKTVDAPGPNELDVVDCITPPCVFYINSTGVMTMKFNAPRYLENFQPRALAQVFGLNVSYPLDQDDGCVGVVNTPCPLAEGEYVVYTYGMVILPIFPAIGVTLEFSLLDLDQNKPFVCFGVDLQISNH